MAGKPNVSARVAAIGYTVVVASGAWFTLAWAGWNQQWHLDELLVFVTIALSSIPICILCFKRNT